MTICSFALAISAQAQDHTDDHRSQHAGENHRMEHMHSMIRHHYVMREGLPITYQELSNPITASESVLANGHRIYTANCSTCHGETGIGDGQAGAALDPSPSNIRRLPRMPTMSSDAYLYWTVAEGGLPIQTGMPPFKQVLTSDEIWSVILYLRDGL